MTLSSAVSWLPEAALPAHYSLPATGIRPGSPGAGGRPAVHEAIKAGRLARAPRPAGLGSPQVRAAVAASIGLWFERVPSASNVADWPSRGQRDGLLKAGARECEMLVPPDLKDLVKLKTL